MVTLILLGSFLGIDVIACDNTKETSDTTIQDTGQTVNIVFDTGQNNTQTIIVINGDNNVVNGIKCQGNDDITNYSNNSETTRESVDVSDTTENNKRKNQDEPEPMNTSCTLISFTVSGGFSFTLLDWTYKLTLKIKNRRKT